jgi:lysophospholipase L1-like esterase
MHKNNVLILVLTFVITLLFFSCSDNPLSEEKQTGTIDADNSCIQYVGRFDKSDPLNVVFDWPGVYIRAKFEGTSCAIRLIDGSNYYDVTIDDQTSFVLNPDTASVHMVATGLADTIHTILIQKRTEAFVGKGQFQGFILDEGKGLIEPEPAPERRIEFIGNSITCGYGVEGASANSPFKNETENATLSYAALTGRALNADYAMVAYSGKGVVRNYGDANKTSTDPMPSLYGRTLCSDSTKTWDYTSWVPQVVVINLGTNDFSTQPYPDKSVFQDAYKQLINRVQSQYPDVAVFCLNGPMIGEPPGSYIEEVVVDCWQNNSNNKVYYIGISTSTLLMSDRGSDWHPNVSGQQKTADVVVPLIQSIMNW